MLKIFLDAELLVPRINLVPFLLPLKASEFLTDIRFKAWQEEGKNLIYEVENRVEADIAIVPHDLSFYINSSEHLKKLYDSVEKNKNFELISWAFYWGDNNQTFEINGTRIFRTGGYASKSKPYEEGMPSFCEDLAKKFSEISRSPLRKVERPSVSFCGNSANVEMSFSSVLEVFSNNDGVVGRRLRSKILNRLSKSKSIDTEFKTFETFFVGENSLTKAQRSERRKIFVENMLSNQYALIVRGTGNFSYRHYEAMSLGRIPIFINTDCLLPLADLIKWSNLMLIVNEDEIKNISELLLNFHNSNTQSDHLEREIRKVWDEYLTPDGFFRTILSDKRRTNLSFINWSPYKD